MILRELQSSDEEHLLDLDSDPEVMIYLTNGVPSTREDIRAALSRIQALYSKHAHQFGLWAAIEKTTGRFLGWFHFRPSKKDPDNVRRIELGYRLKKAFWGEGYATEGSRALIAKGFSGLGVEEVFATTMKGNLASQKVMEKAGLRFLKNFVEELFPGPDKAAVEYSVINPAQASRLLALGYDCDRVP